MTKLPASDQTETDSITQLLVIISTGSNNLLLSNAFYIVSMFSTTLLYVT